MREFRDARRKLAEDLAEIEREEKRLRENLKELRRRGRAVAGELVRLALEEVERPLIARLEDQTEETEEAEAPPALRPNRPGRSGTQKAPGDFRSGDRSGPRGGTLAETASHVLSSFRHERHGSGPAAPAAD